MSEIDYNKLEQRGWIEVEHFGHDVFTTEITDAGLRALTEYHLELETRRENNKHSPWLFMREAQQEGAEGK